MATTMSDESLLDADLDAPLLKTHLSYSAIPNDALPPAGGVPSEKRCRTCKVIAWTVVSIILLVVIAAATVLTIYLMEDNEYDDWQNHYENRRRILLWRNSYRQHKDNDLIEYSADSVEHYELSQNFNCKFSNCEFRSRFNERYHESFNYYDAVIFDMYRVDEQNLKELFPHYFPNTYYIFAANHPNAAKHRNLHPERSFYNLTMSYKLNSDIIWQRWHFQYKWSQRYAAPQETPNWITPDLSTPSAWQVTNLEQSKFKLAAAVVPCTNVSKQSRLIEELQQFMTVELDNRTDCETWSLYDNNKDFCTGAFNRKYKFFLAFEEQLCDDFVSENFYRALNCSLVPVVLGGANYRNFAPNHTYIDATSFDTLRHLADYLYDLERNLPEYAKYSWWKKYYDLRPVSPLCDICEKMMTSIDRNNVHQPLQWHAVDSWWKDSGCTEKSKFERDFK